MHKSETHSSFPHALTRAKHGHNCYSFAATEEQQTLTFALIGLSGLLCNDAVALRMGIFVITCYNNVHHAKQAHSEVDYDGCT